MIAMLMKAKFRTILSLMLARNNALCRSFYLFHSSFSIPSFLVLSFFFSVPLASYFSCSFPFYSSSTISGTSVLPILSYPVLSCPVLSYPILSYPILSYPILSYPILSYPILSYPIIYVAFHTQ